MWTLPRAEAETARLRVQLEATEDTVRRLEQALNESRLDRDDWKG